MSRYKRKFGGFVLPKWNDAQTVRFFQLYEQHRCLWDLKNKDYRNPEARSAAYQDIILEMKMDCGEEILKKKIKNIRTIYSRELREVKRTRRAGCPDPVYVPTLSWYHEADRFLRNIVSERAVRNEESQSQQDVQLDDHHRFEEIGDDGHRDCIPSDLLEDELIEEEEIESFEAHAHAHAQPNTHTTSTTSNSQWRAPKRISKLHQRRGIGKLGRASSASVAQKAISRLANMAASSSQAEDEFTTFGKLVSSQLRSMPFEKAIVTQNKILNLLTEERVMWLSELENEKRGVETIVQIDGNGQEYTAMEIHTEREERDIKPTIINF